MIAIGDAQPLIRSALKAWVPVHAAATMSAAVRQAFTLAPVGGTVPLSPACASFDMFRDYAERGHVQAGSEEAGGGGEHDTRTVSSRQSAFAEGSWLLGTQAAPACEAGVPTPELTG